MSPELQRCPNGHAKVDPAARFCTVCGSPFGVAEAPRPDAASCAIHPAVAAIGTCPRCGTFTCAQCLRRGPDGTELCITCLGRQASQLPWDNRAQLGTLRAFWRTSTQILLRPTETFGAASPAGGIGSSLWFAIVAQLFSLATTVALYTLVIGIALGAAFARDDDMTVPVKALAISGTTVGVVVGIVLFSVVSTIAVFFLNAGLDHLVLKRVGANPKSFDVTVRAAALSNAAALVGLIPVCGPQVYVVWMLVTRVFAYRGLHQISTGQAAAGALIVPAAFFTLGAIGYVLLILVALAFPS